NHAADAGPTLGDRPNVDRVERGERGALRIREYQHALERIAEIQRGDQASRRPQSEANRPWCAVREPAGLTNRLKVRSGWEAGQRSERAGEYELQICQLTGSRRVRGCVAQHLIGQRPAVHAVPPFILSLR